MNKNFNHFLAKFQEEKVGTTCFTISSTSKHIDFFYYTPTRVHNNFSLCGVVVSNTQEAIEFAQLADGHFDYIAVDSEKKICPSRYTYDGDEGNIKGEVQDIVRKSKLLTYKANDITVDAIDQFTCEKVKNLSNVKIAIVGAGNIGFKVALKLVERGFWVNLYRRNQELLVKQSEIINEIKPKGTLAKAIPCDSIGSTVKGCDVIIATATTSSLISIDHLNESEAKLLIDCGKNCFSQEIMEKYTVFRTDITFDILYKLQCVKDSNETLYPRHGAKTIDNTRYVSGVSGTKGDIIVSDISKPLETVIGVCDGLGNVKRIERND
ncbi:NAD(P)-binding domain-containing protein [Halobacteriovorax sp. HLS]|uniref:NAD(P)-binding domain-containing protein n=1 Tax=Halobacteriovorax sp. HLS TaxID=2234000 RepID=UPI000FDC5233|nr:NAD(P)-binding domain-containing protein [Halobacteriovorax sp. HLS]